MPGIVKDKIRTSFFVRIHKILEQHFIESIDHLQQQKISWLPAAQISMGDCLGQLCDRYRQMQAAGKTGELRWIYISYLRSGVLERSEWYRIDAYDSRGCASVLECAENWKFTEVENRMYSGIDRVKAEFDRQTYVKEYELDFLQYQIADRFHQESQYFFSEIIEGVLKKDGERLFGERCVDFMSGEYLDKSQFLLGWDSGRIFSAEEHEKSAEIKWEENILNTDR